MVKIRTAHHRFGKTLFGAVLSLGVIGSVSAQSDDAQADSYASLLKKSHDLEVELSYLEMKIGEQERIIGDLRAEIDGVPALLGSVRPLVEKMVTSYAAEFEIDPPFNASERYERLAKLQEQLELNSSPPQVMLNRAIGMYEKEVEYGMTVAQYAGNNPLEDRSGWRLKACQESLMSPACNVTNEMREAIREKTGVSLEDLDPDDEEDAANMKLMVEKFEQEKKLFDGNYLRVGRLALIYADVDGEQVYRYDVTTKRKVARPADAAAPDAEGGEAAPQQAQGRVAEWVPVDGAERINLFRAVKMAKGEAAPDVMTIPVLVE